MKYSIIAVIKILRHFENISNDYECVKILECINLYPEDVARSLKSYSEKNNMKDVYYDLTLSDIDKNALS